MSEPVEYTQSKEPIAWGLFGFGGMAIAFALPALTIYCLLSGTTDATSLPSASIHAVMNHWWGAGALSLIVLGIAFHCVHRIYYSLCDLGAHPGKAGKVILYGFATLLTVAAAVGLVIILWGGPFA